MTSTPSTTVKTSLSQIHATVAQLVSIFKSRTINPDTIIPLIVEIASEARTLLTVLSGTTINNVVVSVLQVLLPDLGLADATVNAIISAVPLVVQGLPVTIKWVEEETTTCCSWLTTCCKKKSTVTVVKTPVPTK